MSHAEQLAFFEAVADANGDLIRGASVLEIGSYDVNGTIRGIFGGARRYVGVDLVAGPGVEEIGFGHELTWPDGAFDLAISGECFEHDQHWPETFTNMVRMTRPGGLVAFTCGSRGRLEHGTRRTGASSSPGTQAEGLDYYRNLIAADFAVLPLSRWFADYQFWYLPSHFDLYFAGVKAGEAASGCVTGVLPEGDRVEAINRLTPLAAKVALLPLRLLAQALSDDQYQSMVWPARSLARRVRRRRMRA